MKITRFSASSMLFPEVVTSSSSVEIICWNDLIRIISGFGTSIIQTNIENISRKSKSNNALLTS